MEEISEVSENVVQNVIFCFGFFQNGEFLTAVRNKFRLIFNSEFEVKRNNFRKKINRTKKEFFKNVWDHFFDFFCKLTKSKKPKFSFNENKLQ